MRDAKSWGFSSKKAFNRAEKAKDKGNRLYRQEIVIKLNNNLLTWSKFHDANCIWKHGFRRRMKERADCLVGIALTRKRCGSYERHKTWRRELKNVVFIAENKRICK